jgi:hypothetical protein
MELTDEQWARIEPLLPHSYYWPWDDSGIAEIIFQGAFIKFTDAKQACSNGQCTLPDHIYPPSLPHGLRVNQPRHPMRAGAAFYYQAFKPIHLS